MKNKKLVLKPQNINDMDQKTRVDMYQGFTETFLMAIKRYIKTPTTYFTFFIPFILILGLGTIIPADKVITAIMSVGIVSHALLAYGSTWFVINKSSIYKNIYTRQLKN